MSQVNETLRYLASDGQHVVIPPRRPIPEHGFDPEPFRDEIRKSAVAANKYRYFWLESHCVNVVKQVDTGLLAKRPKAVKVAEVDAAERIISAVRDARLEFDALVEQTTEKVINSLNSTAQMTQFHVSISELLGFHFSEHCGGAVSDIKRLAPWLLKLLKVMPDAHFVAMVRTFRNPALFHSHFRFHAPRLSKFLDKDIGDIRHLECDIPKPHRYADYRIDMRDMFIKHETGVAPSVVFDGDKSIDLRTNALFIQDKLRLSISYEDVLAVYQTSGQSYFTNQLTSFLAIDEKPYRGQMLRGLLNGHKDTGLLRAPQHAIWPYFAEQMDQIDAVLNGACETEQDRPKTSLGAMKAIAVLPAVPMHSLDALKRIASDGKKSEQKLANSILENA